MTAAKKVRKVVEIVESITELFEAVRDDDQDDDQDEDQDEAQAAAESRRDDLLADILDHSEQAQATLAATLTAHAEYLHAKIADGDAEAAALGAVILRALAAHSQAEAVRSLMESPDLSGFVNVAEDDDGQGGDDD